MDFEILGTLSTLNSSTTMREANLEIVHPSNWLVLFMESGKKVYAMALGNALFLSMNSFLLI